MNPRYITIITTVGRNRVDDLRSYLRKHVEPRFNEAKRTVVCRPEFRFDRVSSLHFCSFVILEEDKEEGLPAALVFEATFDGPREDFLDALLHVAPAGMQAVYEHCAGYPQSGLNAIEFVKEYLIAHDVGANTFFAGSHGRTASQINRESRIRRDLIAFLGHQRERAAAMPATLAGLQQIVQDQFIRKKWANRWAEQPAVVPWEVAYRRTTARVAVALGLALACVLGAIVFATLGYNARSVVENLDAYLRHTGGGLEILEWGGLYPFRPLLQLGRTLQMPSLFALVGLSLWWFVARLAELVIRHLGRDPRDQSFEWRYVLQLAFIVRYVIVVFLIGFTALAVVQGAPSLHPELLLATTVWIVVGALVALLGLRHWATSLRLQVELQELPPKIETRRRFFLDVLRFSMVIVILVAILAVARHIPVSQEFAIAASGWIVRALVVAAYVTAGLVLFYAAFLVLALCVRALELIDRRSFSAAAELANAPMFDSRAYAREDGGINRYQNHLASLTYVKPGFLRHWFLRLTLFTIDLLSRFWFNRGELGGIPTILSARWVMIDGGRRLLFLDNYGGGWESYLNEFIDMGAVKGLNAIWTNTFVKRAGKKYAFPETDYYLWSGAQMEPPFKAYVRQSQIETLVWYSAYPALSIININTNTDVRQALFKPLAPFERDAIFHRL